MHSIPDLTAVIPARPDDSKTVFSQITQKKHKFRTKNPDLGVFLYGIS